MAKLANKEIIQLDDLHTEILAEYGQDTLDEIEQWEREGDGILYNAMVQLGGILRKAKPKLKHGHFTQWYQSKWGISRPSANRLMKINEAFEECTDSVHLFPTNERAAYAMAKVFLETSESERPQLLEQVKEKTEEKGKALTEKEIKELAQKEYQQKLDQLRKHLKTNGGYKWSDLELAKHHRVSENVVSQLREDVDATKGNKQNRTEINRLATEKEQLEQKLSCQKEYIKSLNATIKDQYAALAELEHQKLELTDKAEEIDRHIEEAATQQVQEILQPQRDALNQEKLALAKQERQLKEKLEKLQQEKKEISTVRKQVELEKSKTVRLTKWIDYLERFNHNLNDNTLMITSALRELSNLPDLSILRDESQQIRSPQLRAVLEGFWEASDAYSKAVTKVGMSVKRIEEEINLPATIDVQGE